jgi:hypothetical protein
MPGFPSKLRKEFAVFRKLTTPQKIQDFLDALGVNFEERGETCRSPREVLKTKKAHCMEGAMLAAAALWYHGEPPLVFDLRTSKHDVDHVVTLFKRNGAWGALSKTNHAVLRYRDPMYRTLRELALSYFHEYFLDDGRKTLRDYSRPLDLRRFGTAWLTEERDLWEIPNTLDDSPHSALLAPAEIKSLRRADRLEIRAGKLVAYKKKKA